jgi:cyclase
METGRALAEPIVPALLSRVVTKRTVVLLLATGAALLVGLAGWSWRSGRIAARSPSYQPKPPIGETTQLAPNLYLIAKGGGNTAVWVTAKGVLLVDTKYEENGQALLEKVREITDKPIVYVVNTHCHGDHIGGNTVMPPHAEIFVHQNTATNLRRIQRELNRPVASRPLREIKDKFTLFDGDDAVDLYYFGPAHTDGDLFVVFRSAGVIHVGDVFPDKISPIINLPFGGNPKEYGIVIGKAIATVENVTRVITGHGPVRSWQDLADYGEFNRILLAQAQAAMRSGQSADEARKLLVLPAKFNDYQLDRLTFTFYDIYKGLTPWWHLW